MTRITA